MPSRSRTKPSTYIQRTFTNGSLTNVTSNNGHYSEFMSDTYETNGTRPHHACMHHLCVKPYSGPYTYSQQPGYPLTQTYVEGHIDQKGPYSVSSTALNNAILAANIQFHFQRNNGFEVLNFLGELEETLEIFTKKFFMSLFQKGNYATLSWGVLPIISDLKALYSTFTDLYEGRIASELDKFQKSQKMSLFWDHTFDFPYTIPPHKVNFRGRVRYKGLRLNTDLDFRTALNIALDEIGFHPDIKTVWDLLPFSFVLDYILPVGDFLEALSPRGWFRPEFSLDGYISFKGDVTTLIDKRITASNSWYYPRLYNHMTYYRSTFLSALAGQKRTPEFTDLFPVNYSLREQFNTLYLGLHSGYKIPKVQRTINNNRFLKWLPLAMDAIGLPMVLKDLGKSLE